MRLGRIAALIFSYIMIFSWTWIVWKGDQLVIDRIASIIIHVIKIKDDKSMVNLLIKILEKYISEAPVFDHRGLG